MRRIAWILCLPVLVGCTTETRLKTTAEALAKGAEECLYDVRDRKLTYETSPNCNALGPLVKQYIEAGGFRDENRSHAFIAESARTTAWIARATSAAGGRRLSIW